MKHYPKVYEDLYRQRKVLKVDLIESASGTREELTTLMREFFSDSFRELFRIAVRYLWLEKQVIYNGKRRLRRFRNGHIPDQVFSRYMMGDVGRNNTVMTRSRWFIVVSTVAAEMFPQFLQRNPFEEPEYFEWPWEHVGIDYLCFVYQVENRMEMMEYANEKQMSFLAFKNWSSNYVLSYNDSKGEEIYSLSQDRDGSPYIKHRDWEKWPEAHDLENTLYNEYAKETETNSDEQREV